MIDFHSHVLPKLDDGSKSVEMSVAMLEECKRQGITTVVCTPHYYGKSRSPKSFIEKRAACYSRLAPRIPAGMTLRLGAEVYFTEDTVVSYEDLALLCIEETRYIMIELPFTKKYDIRLFEKLEEFIAETGCIPLIAHVDRYPAVLRKPSILNRLIQMGCVLQINAEAFSVKGIKRFACAALKNGLVSVVGTDMHNTEDRAPNVLAYAEALKNLPKSAAERIAQEENAILAGEWLSVERKPIRKLFGKYF